MPYVPLCDAKDFQNASVTSESRLLAVAIGASVIHDSTSRRLYRPPFLRHENEQKLSQPLGHIMSRSIIWLAWEETRLWGGSGKQEGPSFIVLDIG